MEWDTKIRLNVGFLGVGVVGVYFLVGFLVFLPNKVHWVSTLLSMDTAEYVNIVIWKELGAVRSTQPSTLCGMVKWVLAVVTPIAREETASSAHQ